MVFAGARSLVPKESGDHIASTLARSSSVSWGESDLASLTGGESVRIDPLAGASFPEQHPPVASAAPEPRREK